MRKRLGYSGWLLLFAAQMLMLAACTVSRPPTPTPPPAPAGGAAEVTPPPTPSLTPSPTATQKPSPTPTPTETPTPTPEPIEQFAATLQQWIEEGRTVEEQEIFDWFNDKDELKFYDTLESARFYLGHLLEVAGVLDYLKQTGAYDQIGIAIKTTFTPTKRSFYGAIGRFDLQFCGYLEDTNYLPLHLMSADEKTAELMDPMKLGAMGYYTGGVDMTWYGNIGPFERGGPRFDYPGHQQFYFFDRETGEPLGVLDMQTLFDEDLYWNDFKKRGRGLWSPYNYKGSFRPIEEDELDFIEKCYNILQEQK